VLVLALLAWPLRSGVPERAAVAGTYRAVAALLDAAAPASAGDSAAGSTAGSTAGWSAEAQVTPTAGKTTEPKTGSQVSPAAGSTAGSQVSSAAESTAAWRDAPSPGTGAETATSTGTGTETGTSTGTRTESAPQQPPPTAPPTAGYDEARAAVTQSLNQSYDLVLARRTRHHGRSPELVRLLAQLNAITPIVEAAPAVHLAGAPLPPEVPAAVRHLAAAVETGYTGPIGLRLPTPASETARAVDHALRHAAGVVTDQAPDPHNTDDRLGRPAALRIRAARAARNVVLSAASWRYGLRLALCIGLAQVLVSIVPVPRSYWVALTITFVMKPDFGSVFSRALLRALGTVAGLVVAAGVLTVVPRGWWDVPVILVLAPPIPAFTPRGYGYQTAAITPVILLLSDLLNHQGTGLLVPRLLDSLVGCAIALVAGYLLWPESWHTRVGDRLADAVADTAAYVEYAFKDDADPAARARRRRRLFRDLSAIRTEFQRALTEPPPTGRRAAAWWPLVVAVERIVDATTAARVRVKQGAAQPSAAEVAHVVLQLRELSQGLRETDVLFAVRTDLTGPSGSVLEPLRQEVAAARAITSPH
jgi:uncharacterized membrane protein YccC